MKRLLLIFFGLCLTEGASYSQVVINEIFADPSPSIGLAEEEFIELYNTSNQEIILQGWQLSDANSNATIEQEFVLEANGIAILCADEHEEVFSTYGDVVVVNSLPSLNNSGDELTIKNEFGEVIDFIVYDNSWYNDPLKSSGGWTLERINPINNCDIASNWSASNSEQGGTPGQANSIEDFNFKDLSEIEVISVYLTEEDLLEIVFSKPPNKEDVESDNVFFFSPQEFIYESRLGEDSRVAEIQFNSSIPENQIFQLTIKDLADCHENSSISGSFSFGIPQQAERGDLLINEILFNPASGGVDFIELANVTEKLFAIDGISILELDSFTDEVIDYTTATDQNKYILPKTLYALSSDADIIKEQYEVAYPENLIELSIPNYPDKEGKLAILNEQLDTLDVLTYSEDWHYELLNRLDGVSLERLRIDSPTQDKTNWFSASYIAGNATPTGKNSQNGANSQGIGQQLILSNELFTPDGDGMNDFLTIEFEESQVGMTATIAVYDVNGFLINTLINNQLIGYNNQIRWTGLNEENEKVAIGHYFILAELIDGEGNIKTFKEKVVVSRIR